MFDLNSLKAIKIGLASPEQIRSWGHGEVLKPETINYRSQKPEPDGLFCEKIFGPVKDYECFCGKYKKASFAGKVCEKCGVEVTLKAVRRERMGYINLAFPCAHIWYVKGSPSKMALTLGLSPKELENVIYFVSRIVINCGQSTVLKNGMVLDEQQGREIFAQVIREEILGGSNDKILRPEENSVDFLKGQRYAEFLTNPRQPFDFISVARYITKYTGARFGTGAEAALELLRTIDIQTEIDKIVLELKDSGTSEKNQKRIKDLKRLEVLEDFKSSGIKPEWMVLTCVPVIPPDLRPMMQLDGGRYATSDLNDLYRAVIIKNDRLKKEIESHAPEVILMNEKRMLQEAVDALIDNERRQKPSTSMSNNVLRSLSSTLKGKQGRFRQNLLGKRVDYSGRSVIAVGPELNMDECGLPREMAVQLFRPFIAHYLIANKDGSSTPINSQKQADELIARGDPRVYDAIEEIVKNHPVLLNRAPTLHRLGIQAFRPKLIDGKAIRLHPLVCPGFNADFDGDQMAVHVPLSRQAQAEALTLMLANRNILKPSDGQPICVPSQDMIYGNYYLTLEDDIKQDEDYAKYYEKRGEPEMAAKFRSYEEYQGKIFSDPDTAILAYQNGLISLRTRIFVPAKSLNKTWLADEKYAGLNHSYLFTTVGKLIFNDIFPNDFPYVNFPYDIDAVKNLEGYKDIWTKDALKNYLVNNFVETPMDIFVTLKQAYDAVIKSGVKTEKDDFDPFKEYAKLQPCRAPIEKKGIKTMMDYIFRRYGAEKTANIMDAFKNQGFDYCTKSGLTISLGDIKPLEGRKELYEKGFEEVEKISADFDLGYYTDDERHNAVIKYWGDLKDKTIKGMLTKRMDAAPRNPMFMMMKSGARGSTDNYMQLIGMKGCMLDATGREIEVPVTDCYADGLSVSEYFTSTHGTRKNGSDTALKTADSGYLTRRLVDVSHNVVIREEDCHCDHGLLVSALAADDGQKICSLKDRIVGRFSMRDIVDPTSGEVIVPANTYMDEDIADKVVAAGIKTVEIRSVLTCESKNGVCIHCYGRNLATGKIAEMGDVVGIMAAQSIGEPGTQLTLKNFHTGGVAGTKDITTGLPRVQELLEVRNPKPKDLAKITTIPGIVKEVRQEGQRTIFVIENDNVMVTEKDGKTVTRVPEHDTFRSYPGAVPCVVEGQRVVAGQALTKGHINPKELLDCTDLTTVRNYIIKEVKAVYSSNGIDIADKHLEIIVRQMTNRLFVINEGDTDLLPGQKVSDIEFTRKNAAVFGKNTDSPKPAVARPLILGITKAALDTESFLSSASFQETTRVLTDAAIKGKTDGLVGLKENVMIGKLIPAGTGIKPLLPPEDETAEGHDGQADIVRREPAEDVKDDMPMDGESVDGPETDEAHASGQSGENS